MNLRTYLLEPLDGKTFRACLTAAEPGILSGTALAASRASDLHLTILDLLPDGSRLLPGSCVLRVSGTAEQIARGEEELLACVGKSSGVATAAAAFAALADGRVRIACGAWKKVAPEVRKSLRDAIATGGAGIRLIDEPFVYLDKNFFRMFSGIAEVVGRAHSLNGRVVVVQLRGDTGPIADEAVAAWGAGAGVLMVDTGKVEDLSAVMAMAELHGFRNRVQIAFGGGVTSERFHEVLAAGPDIIDIGRAIIDAPLLDFRFDVETPANAK
ncbi:MAG: nicotinate-nucleotide pyrophosphorylase [Desulfobaccales bacterium]